MSNQTIMLLAGETSGDLLGAELAKQLRHTYLNCKLIGMAGPKMRAEGVHALIPAETMAIMGLWEIIKHISTIKQAMRTIKLALLKDKPDAVILIDYPGFNLRIADFAHRHGIKVLYYVSPQIWAWRGGRIHKMKQCIDHMTVLFPFERAIYQRAGIPVAVASHPLTRLVPDDLTQSGCQQQLQLTPNKTTIGLLPGSRHQEVEKLLPVMLAAAEKIKQHKPNLQCVLPIADGLAHPLLKKLPDYVTTVRNDTYTAIKACDAIICTSGTATLEVSLLQVPMVLIYKVAKLSYWLGKKLIKTPFIGLCNIIAEKKVCQELIQEAANAQAISEEVLRCLDDNDYRQAMLNEMACTRQRLGEQCLPTQLINRAQKACI